MAVEIEFANVIVLKSAVERYFPRGLDGFAHQDLANLTEDDHLIRVGFMSTTEAVEFVGRLEAAGLARTEGETTAMIALVESGGPVPPWLQVGVIDGCVCCWLSEQPPGEVAHAEAGFVRLLPFTAQETPRAIVQRCGAELQTAETKTGEECVCCTRGDAKIWLNVIENRPSGVYVVIAQRRISRRTQFRMDVALLKDLVSALEASGAKE